MRESMRERERERRQRRITENRERENSSVTTREITKLERYRRQRTNNKYI